ALTSDPAEASAEVDLGGAPFSGPRMISRLRAVFRFCGRFSWPGSSFAVGASPNPSQAIGAPGVVEVAQPVPDAQQPERAAPATSRTMNLVSIVAPVWPTLKPVT